jgi:L-cystine uptake protein TcyP (sodium:dicarboxylate symporter family)
MNEQNQNPTPTTTQVPPTPFRCFTGAAMSGGLGFLMYNLMIAIATSFANKPIHSDNQMVVNISSAVRTLVVGVVALGMGIFGLVAIGLFALMVQLLIQGSKKGQSENN